MEDASLDDFVDGPTEGDDGEEPDAGAAVDSGTTTDANANTNANADTDASAGGGSTDPTDEPANVDDGGDTVAVDPGDVEPAASTYAWSGGAVACEACGEPTERRWRDGDRLVCPDCKEWSGDGTDLGD